MKALTYHGPHHVQVENVPDPGVEQADDIILRITATAICGSDLHLYRGKIPQVKHGDIFGHEFMGEVVETGKDVKNLQKGDRVVIPFVIACGDCFSVDCNNMPPAKIPMRVKALRSIKNRYQLQRHCLVIVTCMAAFLVGRRNMSASLKGMWGRLKYRLCFQMIKRFSFLIFCQRHGRQQKCADPTRFKRCSLWCWSCGIVDNRLCTVARCGTDFVVDHHPYRLHFAADRYGAIPINFDEDSDPAQSIIEQTAGHRGVDAVIDAVGFEAKGSTTETVLTNLKLEGSSGKALRQCIAAVRRGGIVSVPGVYAGFIHGFLFGDAFDKGLSFKMGQTHVHAWLGELLPLIEKGLLKPEEIVTHYMPFEEAARGYEIFEKREEECRKVILVPGAQSAEAAQKAVSGLVNAMPGGTI